MSRTIEAIIAHMALVKRGAMPNTKPLTAIWQSGFETGGYVQRKLRLVFTVAAHHPV